MVFQKRTSGGDYETPYRKALYTYSCQSVSLLGGTPYSCNQHALRQCAFHLYTFPHSRTSRENATIHLERFLDPNTAITCKVQQAIDRLEVGLQVQDWKPDIVIKAFTDLDTVFFDGKLHDMTTISWHSARWWNTRENSRYGHRRDKGVTDYLGNQRAAIHLNGWTIFLDSSDAKVAMWSTVLHEMVVS